MRGRLLMIGVTGMLLGGIACSSSSGGAAAGGSGDLKFHGQASPLPGFTYDTGAQPPASPAQVDFKLSTAGTITVDATGAVNGGQLSGVAGTGAIRLDVHFQLAGHVTVMTALKNYDGDIPGLKNVDIEAQGTASFDPFLVDGTNTSLTAPVPATQLPDIPLGAVPGSLKLAIGDGSVLTTSYQGTCLSVAGGMASYSGLASTSGTLVLKATLALDLPPPLDQSMPLPDITVKIPATTAAIDFGSLAAPGANDSKQGMCASDGNDGGSSSSGGSGGSGGGGSSGSSGGASSGSGGSSSGGGDGDAGQPPTCYANATFTPLPWAPPTPLHQGVCTSTLLSAFDASLSGNGPYTSGDAQCDACIMTDVGASMFGPLLTMGGNPVAMNWGGCVADFDGAKGAGGCGSTETAFNECVPLECNTCSDFGTFGPISEACDKAASAAGGACAGYVPASSCAAELDMGGVAAACSTTAIDVIALWCGP